ncbi:putative mitogen-activated protein kinase kinase kinase 12-like [Capsicum annuum]|nr:putative mitogen-activated protein kinase kinase kinase 12-like [Capsicum annuum]
MSAIVCGKRSFFEDLQSPSPTSSSPPVTKKLRCSSSTSPVRFSSSPPPSVFIDQLRALFPDMDTQLIEKALEECGNDLDGAIKRLHELHIVYADGKTVADGEMDNGEKPTNGSDVRSEGPPLQNNLPADGAEWVELLVREMMSATSVDDARARAARVLESLEQSISVHAGADAAQNVHKVEQYFDVIVGGEIDDIHENMMLKEQIEVFLRENAILKRAVAIQHERQKEYDDRNQEVQQLKQMIGQYQEQIKNLEVKLEF